YHTRLQELSTEHGDYDPVTAEVDFERRLLGVTTDHVRELTYPDRKAIHNLKYFTWVEQQGRTVEELDALWSPAFWTDMQAQIPAWDEAIDQFNADTGALDVLRSRAEANRAS
ncbi:MAG: pyridoxal-5-phosphate-dependent protein subunit beta, partial [Gemmatimonadetes bacterium]|nr:pyridoxal-5-phosphate-dependent protein subunit beta [Gemmatimonadota bacterium]